MIQKLKSLYIDPELQFRMVVTLVVLITLEAIFVGRGLWGLLLLSKDWQRPNLVWEFFWSMFWILVPLVGFNILIGFWWSRKFVRPLKDLQNGLKQLKDGQFETILEPHPRDALKELIHTFNETATRLNQIIRRDQRLIRDAIRDLEDGEKTSKKEFKKVLLSARSKLSVVHSHFNRNWNEGAEPG